MQITIFEDESFKNFLPLVHFRPVFGLRCGALTLGEKFARHLSSHDIGHLVRPELLPYLRAENPECRYNQPLPNDTWLINGRMIACEALGKFIARSPREDKIFMRGKDVAAIFLRKLSVIKYESELQRGVIRKDAFAGFAEGSADFKMVEYPWDLLYSTEDEIASDAVFLRKKKSRIGGKVFPGVRMLNKRNVFVGKGSVVKPGVVLDAEKGPVILGKNVTVMSNAVIEGPVFIGDDSIVKIGAKIYHGTSVGEWCKVGGEVEASIIQSYSNKQHEGFLGHSYLGSWVNIGADTNTSDLKNNYSNVRVQVQGKSVDSGKQFVGLTMGDHSKSGINMMFDTGTVAGVSCNLFGAGLPPKFVPSFTWGGEKSFETYNIEKSIETMKKVMIRRGVKMSGEYENLVRKIYSETAGERENFLGR